MCWQENQKRHDIDRRVTERAKRASASSIPPPGELQAHGRAVAHQGVGRQSTSCTGFVQPQQLPFGTVCMLKWFKTCSTSTECTLTAGRSCQLRSRASLPPQAAAREQQNMWLQQQSVQVLRSTLPLLQLAEVRRLRTARRVVLRTLTASIPPPGEHQGSRFGEGTSVHKKRRNIDFANFSTKCRSRTRVHLIDILMS